jgi:tetratricopeptide (TPR) repeat protein
LEKSVDYFQQAIKLDSGYARAWVGLAKSRYAQADAEYIPSQNGYQKAREAAKRALQLDPNMGEAHAALGWIEMHSDWNWTDADVSYQRALVLEPGNVTVIGGAGVLAAVMGRFDEAIARTRRAIEIDPLNSVAYRNVGLNLYSAGRHREATTALEKSLELAPEAALTHSILSQVYLAEAQPQQALAEANKEKDPEARLQALALAYHALGRKKESDANLTELIGKFQMQDPYYIAEVYAFRRETDKAFEWLERAYTNRDPELVEIKGDPLLKLEHDPRYAALLKKMRLPL